LPGTLHVPPTLVPFLDNLPSPSSSISDQRTPTGPLPNGLIHRFPPTSPTRRGGGDGGVGDGRLSLDDEEDDDDSVTLDDADFQSHYSRHSSPASSSGEEPSDTEEDDGNVVPHTTSPASSPADTHHSLHLSSASNHSLPSTPSLPLFPPFYNRPPNPLPPSPSLTSLLRPPSLLNRSTTSTRPTTPDSSDAETPNDTEAAVAQSARRATVVERVAPKVPTYEYYGFVLYLASSLTFRKSSPFWRGGILSHNESAQSDPSLTHASVLYILWSYLPSPILHSLGFHYYPDRWWSLAMPSFLVMLIIYMYVALLSYNVEYLTLPLESIECVVDDAANIAIIDKNGRVRRGGSKRERRGGGVGATAGGNPATAGGGGGGMSRQKAEKMNWRQLWSEGTDAVMDIPIGGVCEVLYGERGDSLLP